MKQTSIFLSLIFCFFSCTTDGNIPTIYVKGFPNKSFLSAELISIPNVIEPDFSMISGDYFIVSSSKSDSMIHFYSLPELGHVKSEGIKGQAEFEFQSFPMFCRNQNNKSLYVWGYTPLKIKKYRINENAELNYMQDFNLEYRESFNNMHILNDSLLIYNAIPSDFAIKKYDLVNKEYTGDIKIKKDNHKESFFFSNRGTIAVNDSSIIYAYIYKKEFDIYDINTMNMKAKVIGDYTPQKIEVGDMNANRNHYFRIVAGKNYLYALHSGTRNESEQEASLEVYDFNWNPVIQYTFDIVPYLFEVDEENGYIIGHNNDYEDYFLKYNLTNNQ